MAALGKDTTRTRTSHFFGLEVAHQASDPEERKPVLAPGRTPRQPKQSIEFLLRTWAFEFIWLCCAIIVLGTVIVVLGVHNGKPTPLWAGGITLNTIVSFGSMLFRVSLMVPVASSISQLSWIWLAQGERPLFDIVRFDRASRGPYGSLQLLWSYNIRSFAFIGAIVSILGLGIGPFFQQSLVFYNSAVLNTSAIAYATFASAYNSTIGVGTVGESRTGQTPTNMHSAIRSGLYPSYATGSTPLFSCPSTHCTWEPFPTLGLSLTCRDAPEAFSTNCTRWDYCWVQSGPQLENASHLHLPEPGDRLNPMTVFYFAATQFFDPFENNNSDTAVKPSLINGHVELEWVRADELVNPISPGIGNTSKIESRYCTIQLKVQEMSAEVFNGTYTETINQEFADFAIDETPTTDGRSTPPHYNYYYYNASNGDQVEFSLWSSEYNALLGNVLEAFSGMEEWALKSGEQHIYKTLRGNITAFTDSWNVNFGADALRALYADSDTTASVTSLVQQMNLALRSYNSFQDIQAARKKGEKLPKNHISSREQVPGRVYIDKVHARVRWAWLALPIVLVIVTTVLLVATVWLSNTGNLSMWKESPLVLLLFGRYEGETRPISSSARDEAQIKLVASDLTAQLTPDLDTSDENLKSISYASDLGLLLLLIITLVVWLNQ